MLDCGAWEIDASAMRLILLRHAKTEKAEGGMSDRARRLNARGKADAPVIGAYMARHSLIPELVLVSTAERARQTWERVAAMLPSPPRVAYEERLYNAGAEAIIALVKGTAPTVRTLLVVGHNPGLHEAARRLIGRDLIVLKPTDEEAQTPHQGGMLDFCPQKTELDVITPEASEGKSGQQLGRRHDMNELRSVLLAEDKLTC